MPFAAACSTAADTPHAIAEVCSQLGNARRPPDLAVAFFSPHHADRAADIAGQLTAELWPGALIGCIGEAIVAGDREIEHAPALSVLTARWNSPTTVVPFHLVPEQTPDGLSLLGWPDELVEDPTAASTLIVLGDPFTFPATEIFLPHINRDYPNVTVHGGMASGMAGPGETPILCGSDVKSSGAVGVMIRRAAGIRSVVSQGCRPVGRPLVVTRAQDHHVLELGGKAPLEHLRALYAELPARDQELFQKGPHVGLVIDECRETFTRGDFLVRNLYAVDRASGAMTITDRARVGQTVQFHIRDADSADEDLHLLLRQELARAATAPQAALLFTCNGRGTRMFPGPNHDSSAIRSGLGAAAVAGFFAAGEFGPIGRKNFLHGFTASVVLFEDD